ncbi:phage portal protein [Lysobacter brunescens]|uniref:Phage portal protein n=1 Tax=Lysobacter brunescens TaxID=262323 RepID=A0ABW2YHB1_9GAMM
MTELTATAGTLPAHAEVFSFDEPTAVMDRAELFDFFELMHNGRWYDPPVAPSHLAKLFEASPHHSSAIYAKRNILLSTFIPSRMMDAATFSASCLDLLVFGDAYLERRMAINRRPLKLQHSLSMYTRVGTNPGQHWFVQNYAAPFEFAPDSVFHLREPDLRQEIYGRPQYLAAIQSLLLDDAATVFRRRYYANGSHAGFILYINDALHESTDIEAIKAALRDSRGKGNFRNFFIYSPNGKNDGVKLIPISEVASKDDFKAIKETSRNDILAAHRVPPQLLGLVPNNTGGFGKASEAAEVFVANELLPLQIMFRQINDWVGEEVVSFRPYVIGQPKP